MRISDVAALARPRVSLMVALATLLGAALHGGSAPGWAGQGARAALGAFVLCAGCSAVNQVQERDIDGLMRRTRQRPLAAGRVSPLRAVVLGACGMLAGALLFLFSGGPTLAAVAGLVVLVYNGLYTPLKRRTSLALLVGGVAGALPPVAGWLAAGGNPADPAILSVAGLFYLWQVPHFWLLAEKYRDDYARAGLPVPERTLPQRVYRPLMGLWVVSYFTALACPRVLFGVDTFSPMLSILIVACGVFVARSAMRGRTRAALASIHFSMAAAAVVLFGGAVF